MVAVVTGLIDRNDILLCRKKGVNLHKNTFAV